MIGLLLALVGLAKNFLSFKTRIKELDSQAAMAATKEFWQYQIEFIKMNSGLEMRITRDLVVQMCVAGLIYSPWMAILADNASRMPIWGWFYITWAFIGAEALYVLPWFKGFSGAPASNGNGVKPPNAPTTPPVFAVPVTGGEGHDRNG